MDGSGWEGVYKALKKDGYTVTIVQNPTISLADDVAVTKRAIAVLNGPVILVGHSYGGAVITRSGQRPEGRGPGLHHSLCSGQGRIGVVADQEMRPRARPFRRSCRRRMDSCFSIRRSSRPHSRQM